MDKEVEDAGFANFPKRKGWREPYIYQYKGAWFPRRILSFLLHQEEHRGDLTDRADVVLITTPKSGTTWLKALAFAITRRHHFSPAEPNHPLLAHNPHELVRDESFRAFSQGSDYSKPLLGSPSKALVFTHLPHSFIRDEMRSSDSRAVYLCRNPGDTLVSMWKFLAKLRPAELGELSLEDAFEMFCSGASPWGPYWEHVIGYWKASKEMPEKVLFLTYEELQSDQISEHLKSMANFMGVPFSVEEEEGGVVDEIIKLCSFDNLRNVEANKSGHPVAGVIRVESNLFFRNGIVGDSAKYLSEEMLKTLKAITQEKFGACGLKIYV